MFSQIEGGGGGGIGGVGGGGGVLGWLPISPPTSTSSMRPLLAVITDSVFSLLGAPGTKQVVGDIFPNNIGQMSERGRVEAG